MQVSADSSLEALRLEIAVIVLDKTYPGHSCKDHRHQESSSTVALGPLLRELHACLRSRTG